MRGQVTNVNTDFKIAGKYNGIEFLIETDRGEEKKYSVFGNSDCAGPARSLKKGQWVELGFEQKGKYKNVNSITVIEAPAAAGGGAPMVSGYKGANPDQFRSKEELRRSVALETAARLVKPASVSSAELINLAVQFENYLENGLKAVVADALDEAPPF